MEGREVFKFASTKMPESVAIALKTNHLSPAEPPKGGTPNLHSAGARGREDVVVAGDDQVGQFVQFVQRFLGLVEVVAVGKNLAREKVGGGGDGVAGDDRGACRLGDQQAGLARPVGKPRID